MTTENQSVGRDLEELCMRLLDHPHPDGPTSVDLLVGSLPESIAADIPTSPDWRVVGSALYSRGGRPTLMEAVVDAPNSFGELVGTFQRDCVAIGWSVLEPTGPMHGGFVAAEHGDGRAFRREGQGPVLSIQGVSREGMAADVRLRLDWDSAAYLSRTPHMSAGGMCSTAMSMAP